MPAVFSSAILEIAWVHSPNDSLFMKGKPSFFMYVKRFGEAAFPYEGGIWGPIFGIVRRASH